jgi:hypothetical protein
LSVWTQWALILESDWVMLTKIQLYNTVIGNNLLQHLIQRFLGEEYHAVVSKNVVWVVRRT